MLEAALAESTSQTQADKQKQKQSTDKMPPTSHTLMDLVITLSIYLPRSSFQTLFSLASLVLPQSSDPQLQKKGYKLLPRLATSPAGQRALQERNAELQQMLLSTASSTSTPARRDRLSAIAIVVEYLPWNSLHFIPSILSEVVISAKEVNEKARTAAFDLLVAMGKKMAEGHSKGVTIDHTKIAHMEGTDAPNAESSLEEFFTMVSAGLAATTPHMISASITALTRILYEFRTDLSDEVMEDLVKTMDLFLTSTNREIVRSVFGFVKVAIISLPDSIILPRLETLVPSLINWSHEHKNRFRSKVKHIFERMMRRFGYDVIEKYTPEADKKFVHNIRKTKERNKRKKETSTAEGDPAATAPSRRAGKFESEFDEAVYESDGSNSSVDSIPDNSHSSKRGQTYIIEDEDEPLDLLDRKSLAHISSTRPLRTPSASNKPKIKAKTNLDGKLVFNDDSDEAEAMEVDDGEEELGDGTLEGGINAYVDAIRGRDAVQRGRGGKLKFSNRKRKEEDRDEMEVDEAEGVTKPGAGKNVKFATKPSGFQAKGRGNQRRGLDGGRKVGGNANARGRFGGGGRVAKSGNGGRSRGGSGRGVIRR